MWPKKPLTELKKTKPGGAYEDPLDIMYEEMESYISMSFSITNFQVHYVCLREDYLVSTICISWCKDNSILIA